MRQQVIIPLRIHIGGFRTTLLSDCHHKITVPLHLIKHSKCPESARKQGKSLFKSATSYMPIVLITYLNEFFK